MSSKKFVFLTQITKSKLGMCSEKVDEVWHQFILFKRQYHKFCGQYLNEYLHHSPHTLATPKAERIEGSRNFRESYEMVFGEMPEIWNVVSTRDCSADVCGADQCSGCGNQCSKSD